MPNLVQSKNNNILLLGGNGFVGAHILNEFIKMTVVQLIVLLGIKMVKMLK